MLSVPAKTKPAALSLSFLLFGLVAIVHFFNIYRFSVDVPYYDEWEALTDLTFLKSFDWNWIIRQHNEHRIVATKLITWISYHLDGLNFRHLILLNFFIFLLIPVSLIAIYKRCFGQKHLALFVVVCTFMLSDSPVENHTWAFQSQFHISILSIIWLAYHLSKPSLNNLELFWVGLLSTVAIFSFSNALPIIAGFFAIKNLFILHQKIKQEERWVRTFLISRQMLANLIFVTIVAMYFVDYQFNSQNPFYVPPWTRKFWSYFTSFFLHGFGFSSLGPKLKYLLTALAVIGISYLLARSKLKNRRTIVFSCLILSIPFISALIISYGRANLGIQQAMSSRYTEFSFFLIPGVFLLMRSVLKENQKYAYFTYLAVLLIANRTNFKFQSSYKKQYETRSKGLHCAYDFYDDKNGGQCDNLYPVPIPDRLEIARQLELSFYTNWEKGNKAPYSQEIRAKKH